MHLQPNTPDCTAAERKEDFVREITLYVGNRRLDEALAREELAQLEGAERHMALSKNLIIAAAIISRKHKRDSCRLAVFLLISMLSDNSSGCCVLSSTRMAAVLGRDERNIRAAIDVLELDGLIAVDRTKVGLPRAYWPLVPRAIPDMHPACAWFVDALSDKPAPWGRPRLVPKTPDVDTRTFKNPGRQAEQYISTVRKNADHEVGTPTSNSSKGTLDGSVAAATAGPRPPRNTGGRP